MNRHQRILNLLYTIARDSEPVASARLAAAIVLKNKIIAIGTNGKKTHPLQAKYSKNDDAIFIHAEIAAISNALKLVSRDDLKRATLYICRAKRTHENQNWIQGLSKPCKGCTQAIAAFDIGKVIFSLENEGWEYL